MIIWFVFYTPSMAMTQPTVILDPNVANPPKATRIAVHTTLHGETLEDDYSWLRGKEKPEVIEYLDAENAYFNAVMEPTKALQDDLYKEILGRIKEDDQSVPLPKNGWLYYSRTETGKSYPIRCRKKSARGPEVILLDQNELAKDKAYYSIGSIEVSPDGSLLAYTTDETGYRQYKLHVKNLTTGETIFDVMDRVDSVEWAADNRTLFFVQEHPVTKRGHQLYRMELGSTVPTLIMQEDDGLFDIYLRKTQDERFLVFGSASKEENDVFIIEAELPTTNPRQIFGRNPKERYSLEHNAGRFYVRTDKDAKNFRIISTPLADPLDWSEVVPHDPSVRINSFLMLKNNIAIGVRENGLPGLRVLHLATGNVKRLKFADATYSVGIGDNAEFDTDNLRFNYASPVNPMKVVELNLSNGKRTVLKRTEAPGFDGSKYTTDRVWATASDGAKIPIGLVYRKDLEQSGMPTFLYAYGSYGASASFGFGSNVISLLDRGFVYAVAQIRGGGDMGEEWYDAGKMARKMNTFTDFIACADHLVSIGRSDREKLVIAGGSAGGLLMGATLNLRPDLCKAALVMVPFVDVINTMLDETLPLTTSEFNEWGNPKIAEQYAWIRAYSPYENLRHVDYPAMLVVTSLNDSQVSYHEPAKYVAKLRAIKTDHNPLLFKCRMDGGHGGASGRYDSLKDVAMQYAFVLAALGTSMA